MEAIQTNNGYVNTKDLFACSLGRIIEDRLVLFKPNNAEIILDDIAFVEYKKIKKRKWNIIIACLGFIILFISNLFLNHQKNLIIIIGLILSIVAVFAKTERAYIQIILKTPKRIIIKLEKKEQKKGQVLVKKVNQIKNARIRLNK